MFAELDTSSVVDQRQVQIGRGAEAEALLQMKVRAGIFKQVGAAHDLVHSLQLIVDHDGKVVGINSVVTPEHEVADLGLEVHRKVAVNPVLETNFGGHRSRHA